MELILKPHPNRSKREGVVLLQKKDFIQFQNLVNPAKAFQINSGLTPLLREREITGISKIRNWVRFTIS
jgi:hypothetical protein